MASNNKYLRTEVLHRAIANRHIFDILDSHPSTALIPHPSDSLAI